MKIKYLIDTLLSADLQALDFVGRYGGMVSTIYTKQDDFEANGKGVTKRYPVACDVSSVDCANQSLYQDLVPNDEKTSVVYWEEISPMANVGETATKNYYQRRFRGVARLVFWANLAKLGASTCNGDMMAMQLEVERVVTRKGKISGGLYNDSFIRFKVNKDVPQDINTVFGKYDYPKELNYYLYPFGFFAVDVEFEIDYCVATGANVPINPAVDCYNESGLTDCEKILALLTPELTRTCVQPTIDYSVQANFDALSPTQVSDLGDRICTAPVGTQYSMVFDGVNESINCYDKPSYNFTNLQPFSITAWVKSVNYGGTYQGIMTKRSGASGGTGWTFFFLNGDLYCLLQNGINYINMKTTGVTFTNNAWCHVALTVDGSSAAAGVGFYRNAVQLATIPLQDNLNATLVNTSPVVIGNETALSMPFNGNIGYSRLFNKALSGAEVLADYNIGKMLETSPNLANQPLGWKSGQNALYADAILGTNVWLFPNEIDPMLISPYSINLESNKRTTDVP